MNAYQTREELYDMRVKVCYSEIERIADSSPYPHSGNGIRFVDFVVGKPNDKVHVVRVLIDFRGEYFSSFIMKGKPMPIEATSKIRSIIYFSAQDAYDGIMNKVKELNTN